MLSVCVCEHWIHMQNILQNEQSDCVDVHHLHSFETAIELNYSVVLNEKSECDRMFKRKAFIKINAHLIAVNALIII